MLSQAWNDAFHELWGHAAHHRGLRAATGELPGHTLSPSLQRWPRTCGADVVAIAAVIHPVLCNAPLETGGHGVERKWRRCMHELEETALHEPTREYRHNREFWSTFASIAAYLASVDEPVPAAMWPALLAEVTSAEPAHRSIAVVDERLHLAAFSHDELWQAQKTALIKLRGAEVRDAAVGVMGGRTTIPRTVNADVLQLATYWTRALTQVEEKRREVGPHGADALHAAGLDGELRRWRAVLADIALYASHGDPVALYPKNEAFWRASGSLSVTIAAIDEAPAPFDMLLDTRIQRPDLEHRNASYPGEGSFEARWDKQRDDFITARGFDLRDALPGRVGRPMKIPRTLNAEIIKLASDWNAAWKKLDGRRGIFGNLPGEEVGLDTLEKRWKAVMKDVHEIAEPGTVEDVYPKNHEFWREARELAQTLDGYNETPSRFDIAIDVAKTLPDRFADVVGDVMKAVGNVAHKAGEGVTSGLGKPILIAGSVVLGGLLLWRFTSRPRVAEAA
jgi:hypothetical protein